MVQSKQFTEDEMRGVSKDIKINEQNFIVDVDGDIDEVIERARELTKSFEVSIQAGMPDRSAFEEFEGL